MNIVEAKALGLEELQRRKDAMSQDIDRDPNEWTVIVNAISELEWEKGQQQAIEAKTEEKLNEDIPFSVSGIDLGTLESEEIELIQTIVMIDRKRLLKEHGEETLALKTALKGAEDREKAAIEEAKRYQEETAEAKEEAAVAKNDAHMLRFELEKMTEQRNNAAQIIQEKDAEIARLNDHINDLRNQIVDGVKNERKYIEIEAEIADEDKLREIMSRIEEKKRKQAEEKSKNKNIIYVYDVVPLDLKKSRFGAKLATTNEYVEFGNLERQYVEVTQEDAAAERARFLAEQTQLDASAQEVVGAEESVTFPDIKAPDVDTSGMVGGQSEASEGDHGREREAEPDVSTQSLEERVKALEVAVFGGAA